MELNLKLIAAQLHKKGEDVTGLHAYVAGWIDCVHDQL